VVSFDPRGVGQSSPFAATQTPSLLPPSRSTARPRPPNSKRSPEPTRHSSAVASQRRAS
jgi:hypothetical protein